MEGTFVVAMICIFLFVVVVSAHARILSTLDGVGTIRVFSCLRFSSFIEDILLENGDILALAFQLWNKEKELYGKVMDHLRIK